MIQIEACDIIFVTDESDNAKNYVDKIVTVTKTMKQKLDFLQRRLAFHQEAPFTLCERAFFVVDGASSPLESLVIPWMRMLPKINGDCALCFVLCIGRADLAKFEQYKTMGLDPERILYVESIDKLETWWPQALKFIYNANRQRTIESGPDFYMWHIQTPDNEVKSLATNVECLLTKAGLLKGSTPEESQCVVAVFDSPPSEDDLGIASKFPELASIGGKHIHIVTTDKETFRDESFAIHCAIHDKTEMMKCLLWIMSDLRHVGHRRPKNKKPKSCGDICKAVLKYILIALGILIGLPFGLAYVSLVVALVVALFAVLIALFIACPSLMGANKKVDAAPTGTT